MNMAFKRENLNLIGPLNIRRTMPRELMQAVHKHSSGVGQVVWAWNYCHGAFCRLFAAVATPENLMVGLAVWHTAPSDKQQRQMLLAAAGARFSSKTNELKAIRWSISAADKLSNYRNDLTHMGTGFRNPFQKPEIVLDYSSNKPARIERMENVEIDKLVQQCSGDLIALAGYVSIVNAAISFPQMHRLPRRPRLLLVPGVSAKKKRRS